MYDTTDSKRFVHLPISVLKKLIAIGDRALDLYCILDSYTGADGTCFPSQETLAESIGKTPRTVRSLLRKIEQEGLIETQTKMTQRGKQNVYYLPSHPNQRGGAEAGFLCAPEASFLCAPEARDPRSNNQLEVVGITPPISPSSRQAQRRPRYNARGLNPDDYKSDRYLTVKGRVD